MNQNDEVRIPLSFEQRGGDLDQVIAKLQRADAEVVKLQADILKIGRNLGLSAGPGAPLTMGAVQQFVQRAGPSNFPELQPLFARLGSREQEIAQAVKSGQMGPGGSTAPSGSSTAPESPGQQEQRQPAPRRGQSSRAPEPPPSFGQRFAQHVFQARPLISMGALAMGDAGPASRSFAYALMQTIATTPIPRGGSSGSLLGALTGQTLASTVTSTAMNAAARGAETEAADVGAAGLAGAKLGASGTATIGEALSGLIATPLGAIAAAFGVAAGGSLVLNKLQAQAATTQVALGATVGGMRGGMIPNYQDILTQGQAFMIPSEQAFGVAEQLGTAGITGSHLVGGGKQSGALAQTLAFSRLTGMAPTQAANLTSTLMVQGGMSIDQLSQSLQFLQKQTTQTKIPVDFLTNSLQTLETASGGALTTPQGIAGFAAVQGLVGPHINAGALLSPLTSATGGQALALSGMLGMTPAQFANAQQNNPAALYDAVAKFAKSTYAKAGGGQTGIDVTEQVLSSAGIFDTLGVSPANQAQLVNLMAKGQPGAAVAYMKSIQQGAALQGAQGYANLGAQAAQAQVDAATTLKIQTDYTLRQIGILGAGPGQAASQSPYVGPGGQPLQHYVPGAKARPGLGGQVPLAGWDLSNQNFNLYVAASTKYGIPLATLLAQGAAESSFQPLAGFGTGGAEGIAQFMPSTAAWLQKQPGSPFQRGGQFAGQTFNPYDPKEAIAAQAWFDKYLLSHHPGQSLQQVIGNYYGTNVANMDRIQQSIEVQITGVLTDQSGHKVGVITPTKVTVNPGRAPKGASAAHAPAVMPPLPPPRAHGTAGQARAE